MIELQYFDFGGRESSEGGERVMGLNGSCRIAYQCCNSGTRSNKSYLLAGEIYRYRDRYLEIYTIKSEEEI